MMINLWSSLVMDVNRIMELITSLLYRPLLNTESISIEYQDFWNIFRLFSDYILSKTTRRLRYPNNKAFLPLLVLSWALVYFYLYLDIHDVLRGLLGPP